MSIFDTVSQLLAGKKVVEKVKEKKIQRDQPTRVNTRMVQEMIKAAEMQARTIIVEAKDEALRIRHQTQEELRQKEEWIERKIGSLEERQRQIFTQEADIHKRLQKIEQIKTEQLQKLERAAQLTREEAKQLILKALEDRLQEEMAKKIKEAEEKAQEEAQKRAQQILVDAMRHGSTDYVAEYTMTSVKLPDEDMKGRIIGKEGRNIRTLETSTGVDVDLDEEGVIKLSSFDPVRREIARVALERLMKDGRIQPARIEEIVVQVKKDIEQIMYEAGEKLCHDVGVFNLPHQIVALLGRFKYRFSYGQNMIAHTLEETKVGVSIAYEIKADVNVVRLGCLLHDIGKVITDKEGSHVDLGVDLLKKYDIPQPVINCVAQHHEDTPFTSTEAILVYIADAISGSRPGARYEDIEAYIKRLDDLEKIATSNEGVKEAYAFQAGRELRVIVEPEVVDDAKAVLLAQKIREEIERKMTYPGQIRVTVIRELRAMDVAK